MLITHYENLHTILGSNLRFGNINFIKRFYK